MRISGYASRFDERDVGGDRVKRGAFAASLLSRSRPLPMLSNHQRRIGTWTRAVEDEAGLWVEGEVTDSTLQRLIRGRKVSGLSIGYRTRRSRDGPGQRDLLDVDLKEVSVVAFPMLGTARITQIDEEEPRLGAAQTYLHATQRIDA